MLMDKIDRCFVIKQARFYIKFQPFLADIGFVLYILWGGKHIGQK